MAKSVWRRNDFIYYKKDENKDSNKVNPNNPRMDQMDVMDGYGQALYTASNYSTGVSRSTKLLTDLSPLTTDDFVEGKVVGRQGAYTIVCCIDITTAVDFVNYYKDLFSPVYNAIIGGDTQVVLAPQSGYKVDIFQPSNNPLVNIGTSRLFNISQTILSKTYRVEAYGFNLSKAQDLNDMLDESPNFVDGSRLYLIQRTSLSILNAYTPQDLIAIINNHTAYTQYPTNFNDFDIYT